MIPAVGGPAASLHFVITRVVDYVIDPAKIEPFERFARSCKALALFRFPGVAAYEQYRSLLGVGQPSSRLTGSGMKAAVCCGTSGPPCARSCQTSPPDLEMCRSVRRG